MVKPKKLPPWLKDEQSEKDDMPTVKRPKPKKKAPPAKKRC